MAEISIPGVDFKAIAEEAIAHQITKAMVGSDAMIQSIVAAALAKKVDDKGAVSQYQSSNTLPYIVWMTQDLVRAATRDVLAKQVESMRPAIEAEVAKALKAAIPSLAKQVAESFQKQVQTPYFTVSLSLRDR